MPVQSFDAALKEFKKEKTAWRNEKATLERQNLQLTAKNISLTEQSKKLEAQQARLLKSTTALETKNLTLRTEMSRLEAQQDALDAKVADKVTELAEVRSALAKQKQTVDRELETYSTKRKQAIKTDILATNDELAVAKVDLVTIQATIDERKNELAELNQTTIDIQDDIKLLQADKQTVITDTASEIKRVKQELIDLQSKYDELGFQYNNALITMKKVEESHKKFQEYEKQARKVLDNKDQELQEREADIAQESVFIKNRRSNLSSL